jgi:hypothetical protein
MKVAKIVVEEINNVDRLHSAFEMGMRLIEGKFEVEKRKTFGFGCGHHCDAWGIFCGSTCLQGLDPTEDMIKARFAIDVLGKKEITVQDMAEIGRDFNKFHEATMEELKAKLSLANMEKRIEKFSKKQ